MYAIYCLIIIPPTPHFFFDDIVMIFFYKQYAVRILFAFSVLACLKVLNIN